MNALVTLAVGKDAQALYSLSRPFFEAYARRHGLAFKAIEEEKIHAGHPKLEKLQLFDCMGEYERIIYVDVDAIIMPHCPNLFDVVPADRFGAFFDSEGGNGDAEDGGPDERGAEIRFYQERYGEIGWSKTYFNSGVMIASPAHRQIFDYKRPILKPRRYIDQTMLNYRLQAARLPWVDVGSSYNHFAALNRSRRLHDTRFASNIIHYAGFAEFYDEPTLYEKMKADAAIVRSGKY